jgi:hypothetical protein
MISLPGLRLTASTKAARATAWSVTSAKWLSARRPEVYREQKEVRHALSMDEAFLRFLDRMDEKAKLEKARNARVIVHQPVASLNAHGQGA